VTQLALYRYIQWKAAVKLEKLGMKHSSGRSVRMHAARAMGMKGRPTHDAVIAKIEEILASNVSSEG
jgi:hypothetical protein